MSSSTVFAVTVANPATEAWYGWRPVADNGIDTAQKVLSGSVMASALTQQITVEAWLYPEQFSHWAGALGFVEDDGEREAGWLLGTSWGNQFSFGLASEQGHGLTYLRSSESGQCSAFTEQRWYHVAGVYDGRQLSLYVDGVLCDSSFAQLGAIRYPGTGDVWLGANHDGNEHHPFLGAIGPIRLWQIALTQQQLRERMAYWYSQPVPGLWQQWRVQRQGGQLRWQQGTQALLSVATEQSVPFLALAPWQAEVCQSRNWLAKLQQWWQQQFSSRSDCLSQSGSGWRTEGAQIISPTGEPVRIKAINWFGLQTSSYLPHGLWRQNLADELARIKALGFNTIRLPFASSTLRAGNTVGGYVHRSNPQFVVGQTSALTAMDRVIDAIAEQGLWIILDRHSLDAEQTDPDLWYSEQVTEQQWLEDWQFLAKRYQAQPAVIAADLHNEPHGRATWGSGQPFTDWRLAATKAGEAILAVNPNWLIVVEGIDWADHFYEQAHRQSGGIVEYPVQLTVANKVVYSVHEYGPDDSGYAHDWFTRDTDYATAATNWDKRWGHIVQQQRAPVLVGEFGGRYTDPNSSEPLQNYPGNTALTQGDAARWLQFMVRYLDERQLPFAFWTWTPNSTNTGGLLDEQYRVIADKQQLLSPLLK